VSTHREIEEVYNEDINKKSKMIKKKGYPIDDVGEEIDEEMPKKEKK
jgi:hypothetical protein